MTCDAYLDDLGDPIDQVWCDYCPDGHAQRPGSDTPLGYWPGQGWDIDPRPGRDRCPDCVTHNEQAATSPAGRRVDVAVGVP